MERNFCCVIKVELHAGDSGGLGRPIEYMDGTVKKDGRDEMEDR